MTDTSKEKTWRDKVPHRGSRGGRCAVFSGPRLLPQPHRTYGPPVSLSVPPGWLSFWPGCQLCSLWPRGLCTCYSRRLACCPCSSHPCFRFLKRLALASLPGSCLLPSFSFVAFLPFWIYQCDCRMNVWMPPKTELREKLCVWPCCCSSLNLRASPELQTCLLNLAPRWFRRHLQINISKRPHEFPPKNAFSFSCIPTWVNSPTTQVPKIEIPRAFFILGSGT